MLHRKIKTQTSPCHLNINAFKFIFMVAVHEQNIKLNSNVEYVKINISLSFMTKHSGWIIGLNKTARFTLRHL